MSYLILEFGKFKSEHLLSGVALFIEDKICLVLPTKFKDEKMYSIPKGHVEDGQTSFQSAHKELIEETGIDVGLHPYDYSFRYNYSKNQVRKSMEVFI